MTSVYVKAFLHCTQPSPVSLKVLLCVLFVFFNRARRIIHSDSTLVAGMDLRGTALIPLLASAVTQIAFICPSLVLPTRGGRLVVICLLLHVLLLYACAILLVSVVLNKYFTAASFLSVLLASHLCFSVRPMTPGVVHAQHISYGYVTRVAAYAIPLLCWVLLPILHVHELEAIVLLYTPETLCFIFAHCMHFCMLLLQVAAVTVCSVAGIESG